MFAGPRVENWSGDPSDQSPRWEPPQDGSCHVRMRLRRGVRLDERLRRLGVATPASRLRSAPTASAVGRSSGRLSMDARPACGRRRGEAGRASLPDGHPHPLGARCGAPHSGGGHRRRVVAGAGAPVPVDVALLLRLRALIEFPGRARDRLHQIRCASRLEFDALQPSSSRSRRKAAPAVRGCDGTGTLIIPCS
jgi:hypothetical protein